MSLMHKTFFFFCIFYRCGSITAIFGLVFSQNDTNYLEPLKEATKSGKLGTFVVDKDSVGDYKGIGKYFEMLEYLRKVDIFHQTMEIHVELF